MYLVPHLNELNIGHAIVAKSAYIGVESAVYEMLEIIQKIS